jgi:hypothetical protein
MCLLTFIPAYVQLRQHPTYRILCVVLNYNTQHSEMMVGISVFLCSNVFS